jgi:hypothetical protein
MTWRALLNRDSRGTRASLLLLLLLAHDPVMQEMRPSRLATLAACLLDWFVHAHELPRSTLRGVSDRSSTVVVVAAAAAVVVVVVIVGRGSWHGARV